MESSYAIHKSIGISAPKEVVFEALQNTKDWNLWLPNLKKTSQYTDTNNVHWRANNRLITVGVHKQNTPSFIEHQIKIEGHSPINSSWELSQEHSQTTAKVTLHGQLSFWEKILSLWKGYPNKQLSSYLEASTNINNYLEQQMNVHSIKIKNIGNQPEQWIISTAITSLSIADSAAEKLVLLAKQDSLILQKSPFILSTKENYHIAYLTTSVVPDLPIDKEYQIRKLPNTTYVNATLKGGYTYLPKAIKEVENYAQKTGYKISETLPLKLQLVKGEKDTKNPANWFTEIWIPIEQKSIESLTAN